MAITFRGRSRRIGSERSGNFGFIILLMDGLGNYQKNIPAQEKATKKYYKADHAKDPYEKSRKTIVVRRDPEKRNSCSENCQTRPQKYILVHSLRLCQT